MAHEEFTLSQVYLWTMVETRELGDLSIHSYGTWCRPLKKGTKVFFFFPNHQKFSLQHLIILSIFGVSPEWACGPTCQHNATLCNCSYCPVQSVTSWSVATGWWSEYYHCIGGGPARGQGSADCLSLAHSGQLHSYSIDWGHVRIAKPS